MTFAIESRIKSVARTRVTSNSVFSNPRRVRKTAESLPKVDPSPLVLVCMRIMTISSTDSSIWAACRYGAKGYLLPILVIAGVRLPIIAYAGRSGRGWAGPYSPYGAAGFGFLVGFSLSNSHCSGLFAIYSLARFNSFSFRIIRS